MASTLGIDIYYPPSECKLVIIPSYGNGSSYHLGDLINVVIDDSATVQVPLIFSVDGSPLVSLSIVYQIGLITDSISGIAIPPYRSSIRLEFVTTGCVSFLMLSDPLSSLTFHDTLTLRDLGSLPDNSVPYTYNNEFKGALISGTSNRVSVSPTYDDNKDTVSLIFSLPQDIHTEANTVFNSTTVKTLNFTSLQHSGGGSSQGVMRVNPAGSLQLVNPGGGSEVYTTLRDGTHAFSGRFEIGTSTTGRVIIGSNAALAAPDTAYDIIAFGKDSYKANNRAGNHRTISIGTEALSVQNSPIADIQGHIAIGYGAMRSWVGFNTYPINASIAIGYLAMYLSSYGYANVTIGPEAMYQSGDGSETVCIGSQTAKKTKPRRCVLIGNFISENASSVEYMDDNVILGSKACRNGPSVAGCQRNVILGGGACPNIANASNNTMAGYNTGTTLTTGSQCSLYGSNTNVTSSNAVNRGAFGYNISNPTDNTTIVANGSTTAVHFGHNNTLTAVGSATLGSSVAPVKGIYLASTGGTSALLDRYEKFNITTTLTGPWSGTKPLTLTVTLIGTQVFISTVAAWYSTGNSAATISTPVGIIPERLRPASGNDTTHFIKVTNAGATVMGIATVSSNGTFSLIAGLDSTISPWNHSAGSIAGWGKIDFSYTL